jgi:NAD(P)-dependent dehydrogenase (short-subunit alcohol dehydrogenase family)
VVASLGGRAQGTLEAEPLDIASRASVGACIEHVHQRHRRIDAVVNAAYPRSANYGRRFEDVAYEDFCEHQALHLGGYFLVAQRFADYFRRQGHGAIVNVASIYGMVAPRFAIYDGTCMTTPVEYAAAKGGIIQLTRYLAAYLKGTNIRVNTITPGGIEDGQPASFLEKYRDQCLGKGMLDRTDIDGTLVYLLSDMAAHVNGQNLVVDDGFTV